MVCPFSVCFVFFSEMEKVFQTILQIEGFNDGSPFLRSNGIPTAKFRGERARTIQLSTVKETERCYGSSVNSIDVSPGEGKL